MSNAITPNFALPPLSSAERVEFISVASNGLEKAVQNTKLCASQGALTIKNQQGKCLMVNKTVVEGNLKDISLAYLSYTYDPRRMCTLLQFIDTKLMYQIDTDAIGESYTPLSATKAFTGVDTFLAIRWGVHESPLPLSNPRDMCFLEYYSSFTDSRGRQGWGRYCTSIEHRSCPDLERIYDYVRCAFKGISYVYIESNMPGHVDVFTIVDLDLGGSLGALPSWIVANSLKNKLMNVSLLRNTTTPLKIAKIKKNCACCDKSFKLRSKYTCQQCKRVVCRSCSKHSNKLSAERACKPCLAYVKSSSSETLASKSNSNFKFLEELNGITTTSESELKVEVDLAYLLPDDQKH